jgi:hypothetical protein
MAGWTNFRFELLIARKQTDKGLELNDYKDALTCRLVHANIFGAH